MEGRARRAMVVVMVMMPSAGGALGALTTGDLAEVARRCASLDRQAADLVSIIERSSDFERSHDNLLLANLTALRIYARSLREVAEEARGEWRRSALRRGARTTRRATLRLMRRHALCLRMISANIELELALQRPELSTRWNQQGRRELDRLVEAVLALPSTVAPPVDTGGGRPPTGFVRVPRRTVYRAPATLSGPARTIRIEAYGGILTVRTVRFTVTELAFGYFEVDYPREVRLNRECRPGRPLEISVDRSGALRNVSKIEVEWEPDGRHRCFGRVSLVTGPAD